MPITLNPSNSDPKVFKVAAVQAEPWCRQDHQIIQEAAAEGAKIIGFPEVFIPGYPWTPWANNFVVTATVLKEYQANALALHSPEMDRIREAVKEADVTAVIGFAERDGGSLYIAQATILPDGKIANHRRKIKARLLPLASKRQMNSIDRLPSSPPTTRRRFSVMAAPTAQSIYNVVQTPFGRLGSLNCWEHIQPWFKTHFYSQHPQIFVGAWWPAFPPGTGGSPYIVSGEASSRMTQMVAMEGGCFGLACCHVVSEAGAEKMRLTGFPWFVFPGGGFSTIYGPDGSTLARAEDAGVEKIVYADISLAKIDEVKTVADIMGNYSRMDLLHTVAHGKNWDAVAYPGEAEAAAERAGEINNFAAGAY
ncbi:carbon-nitrogen hydrolase [Mycena galopus ATCC 62051]|nr:carbon-nitrogen hydrolase [Mycena galopus ATCC 62051]